MREERIIDLLKDKFRFQGKGLIYGIGDDSAVLPWDARSYLLFTSDSILEDIHFESSKASAQDIGWKAIAVNVSDIASMGGIPLYAVVNLGLPRYNLKLIDGIYAGIKSISQRYRIRIVGGDTVRSEKLFLAVAMLGKVEKKYLVLREGAKAGNLIYLTGKIGGAVSCGKHLKFEPRLKEARWITQKLSPSSMIDISDGLLLDLFRICKASRKGALLYRQKIPLAPGLDFDSAVSEGEDFELLFTLPREIKVKRVPGTRTRISCIGKMIREKGIFYLEDEEIKKTKIRGYDHFI